MELEEPHYYVGEGHHNNQSPKLFCSHNFSNFPGCEKKLPPKILFVKIKPKKLA